MLFIDIDEADNFLNKTNTDAGFREFVQCASGSK